MRKLFAAALLLTLLLAGCKTDGIPEIQVPDRGILYADAENSFGDIVIQRQQEYGKVQKASYIGGEAFQGVCAIEIMNLDDDVDKEMLLVYQSKREGLYYTLEVYDMQRGTARMVMQETLPGLYSSQFGNVLIVLLKDGQLSVGIQGESYFMDICQLIDGKMVTVDSVRKSSDSYDPALDQFQGKHGTYQVFLMQPLEISVHDTTTAQRQEWQENIKTDCQNAMVALRLEPYVPAVVEASLQSDTGSIDVALADEMFVGDNTEYSQNMAELAIGLAGSAYDGDNWNRQGNFIYDAYNDLGFYDHDIELFSYQNHFLNQEDRQIWKDRNLALSVATRKLGIKQVLLITFRGSGTIFGMGGADWLQNFKAYDTCSFLQTKAHRGFHNLFKDAALALRDYCRRHPEVQRAYLQGKLKILITGHSLGGAGTNLLTAWLMEQTRDYQLSLTDDIYAYTFASPRVVCDRKDGFRYNRSAFYNVFNIISENDPVPSVPDDITGKHIWERFGRDLFCDSSYGFVLGVRNHEVANYRNIVLGLRQEHKLKEYHDTRDPYIEGFRDILTGHLWLWDYRAAVLYRFNEDGTVIEYQNDPLTFRSEIPYPIEDGWSPSLEATRNGTVMDGVSYEIVTDDTILLKGFADRDIRLTLYTREIPGPARWNDYEGNYILNEDDIDPDALSSGAYFYGVKTPIW